jgi:hypothetical protein
MSCLEKSVYQCLHAYFVRNAALTHLFRQASLDSECNAYGSRVMYGRIEIRDAEAPELLPTRPRLATMHHATSSEDPERMLGSPPHRKAEVGLEVYEQEVPCRTIP